MKRSTALFLQFVIVLVGIATLAGLLWEPQVEGRNARATTWEVYFNDPFLAYMYLGSTPFFVALYRAFGLFRHVRQSGTFSQVTVDALRAIKHCAFILIGFVAGGVVFIIRFGDKEDRPAGIFMSFLVTLAAVAIAAAAAVFARNLQSTLGRSESSRS